MENHKSGFVNIIGNPNAGKSTLLNALVGEKLSIVSPKVQTTRQRILGIVTEPEYQLVFSDTPGILEPKYELQQSMVDSINEALDDADVLLIIISVWEKRNDWELWIERIKSLGKPFIVLINKIDEVDEVKLAENVKLWAEKFDTQNVIPISALKGINLEKIIPALLPFVPVSPPYYDGEELTDKSERFIVAEMIREKIFSLYKEEIPYSVEVMVQEFKDEETIIKIRADIFTERESQKGILLGKGGSAIKKLGIESRKEIEKFLNKNIFLGLTVQVKDNWRNDPQSLKKFGYKR